MQNFGRTNNEYYGIFESGLLSKRKRFPCRSEGEQILAANCDLLDEVDYWTKQKLFVKKLKANQTPLFKIQQGINKNSSVDVLIMVDSLILSDQLERFFLFLFFLGSDHSNATIKIRPWPFIAFEHIINITYSITPGMKIDP